MELFAAELAFLRRDVALREADDCFGPLFRSDPMQLIRQIL